MTVLGSTIALYVCFVVTASFEQFFFMMQRAALEIGRSVGITDKQSREMLPLWYVLVWPVKLAKWFAAVYIGIEVSWVVAIALLALTFLFQIFVPTPHRQFIPIFRRRLANEIGEAVNTGSGVDAKKYSRLYKMLFEA